MTQIGRKPLYLLPNVDERVVLVPPDGGGDTGNAGIFMSCRKTLDSPPGNPQRWMNEYIGSAVMIGTVQTWFRHGGRVMVAPVSSEMVTTRPMFSAMSPAASSV